MPSSTLQSQATPQPQPSNPIASATSFSPSPTTGQSPAAASPQHISPTVAAQLSEIPQQNSSEIVKKAEAGKFLGHLKGLASFALFLGGIFIAALLINQFVFQSYYVDGTSMVPTLQDQDRLIIDKVERTAAHAQGKAYIPNRGQVVVLSSSIHDRTGHSQQLIKRVIGLPGETVIIDNGTVTVKNDTSPEGFNVDQALGLDLTPTFSDSRIEVIVPEGQVYVMGDNRGENQSLDSRSFGPIDAAVIEGRLWARILPLDKAQIF